LASVTSFVDKNVCSFEPRQLPRRQSRLAPRLTSQALSLTIAIHRPPNSTTTAPQAWAPAKPTSTSYATI